MRSLHVLGKSLRLAANLAIFSLVAGPGQSSALAGNGRWTLTGWNNLGMHCMDDDYSVFSILPPYNTIRAQLIDPNGHRVTNAAGISLYYRSMYDPAGSINTSSVGKSNFWRYSLPLFGVSLLADQGLAGSNMPGPRNVPQPMAWDPVFQMFTATGIPIAPLDDRKRPNTYPVMRLIARNNIGVGLALVDIVLPVSSEVDCRGCHASGSDPKARPAAGWVRNPYARRDHRLNILRLHDEKNLANPVYQAALTEMAISPPGYTAR